MSGNKETKAFVVGKLVAYAERLIAHYEERSTYCNSQKVGQYHEASRYDASAKLIRESIEDAKRLFKDIEDNASSHSE